MPVTFKIYPSRSLIVTRVTGGVTRADLERYYEDLLSSADYEQRFCEIFDVTEADVLNITSEDIRQFSSITANDALEGENVKVAIVATGDLEYALSRMYEMHQVEGSIRDIRVFRNRREAEDWLGVTPD